MQEAIEILEEAIKNKKRISKALMEDKIEQAIKLLKNE